MLSSRDDDKVGAQLDSEMAALQEQIASLRAQRKIQATAILSAHTAQSILSRLQSQPQSQSHPTKTTSQTSTEQDTNPLLSATNAQQKHNRENLYRACASITTFRIQDPDPNACDNGKVLGIRIDVSNAGKFAKPYYVMLNKAFPGSDMLRIHRHTIPPCIPLPSLASKYLPEPKVLEGVVKGKKQNLHTFVRDLRRELVGWHNRMSAVKDLKKEFNIGGEQSRKGKERERVIVSISAADAEAKQVRIEWVDGRIGRCVVDDRGEVEKCVVVGEEGRDWEVERRILGQSEGERRMEKIGERLRDGIY